MTNLWEAIGTYVANNWETFDKPLTNMCHTNDKHVAKVGKLMANTYMSKCVATTLAIMWETIV